MRKKIKLFSVAFALIFGSTGVIAQETSDLKKESRKSKREKRFEIKADKIQSNSTRLFQQLDEGDLVVMDDGIGRGMQVGSGLHNFFRIKGDTLTVQKIRTQGAGTAIQSDRDLYKSQGRIRDIEIVEGSPGKPSRVMINYDDILSFEPRMVLIYVHANRFEVRYDDGSRVFIRGKLVKNSDVSLQEIGRNSSTLLLNQSTWRRNGRTASGGIDLETYRGG